MSKDRRSHKSVLPEVTCLVKEVTKLVTASGAILVLIVQLVAS